MFPSTIVVPLDGAMSIHARVGTARFALGSVTMGAVGMARRAALVSRTV